MTAEVLASSSTPLGKFQYFFNLPEEICHEIYPIIFPHRTISITRLGQFFRIEGVRLLIFNRQIFEECKEYLWIRHKFLSKNLSGLENPPLVMGVAVSKIKHLQLDNTFATMVTSEREWPNMMRLMQDNFTSLCVFENHTKFLDPQPHTHQTDRERWIR